MKLPPLIGRSLSRGQSAFAGARAADLVPQSRLSGPVPWVIAVMIALTVIAAGGGLALNNLADSARAGLSGSVTVQVIEANPRLRNERATAVAAALRDDPQVARVRLVPEDELEDLLEPWLGTGEVGEAVPIPALIDATLVGGASPDRVNRLQASFDERFKGVRIDAQSDWLAPVYSALSSLQYLAAALVALLAFTSAAAVWFAARSAFANHAETIEIVHHLGGTDDQIARIFQRSVALDAIVGGVAGLVLGLVVVLLIGNRFAALDSGMVAGGGLGLLDWLLIAAIPLVGVALAILTARMTVLSSLRKML